MPLEDPEDSPTRLFELVMGTEIAVLELALFLHDQKVINKDEFSARLLRTADQLEEAITKGGVKVGATSFPLRRLASALKEAVKDNAESEERRI